MNWPRSLHPQFCLPPRAHREIAQAQLSAHAAPTPAGPMSPLDTPQPKQSLGCQDVHRADLGALLGCAGLNVAGGVCPLVHLPAGRQRSSAALL